MQSLENVHTLANEPMTQEEAKAYVTRTLIGNKARNPFFKHIIRRLEPRRARTCLNKLDDKGARLFEYVSRAGVELKDPKVIQFTKLFRILKPRVVYEFGAGGSTCLFAELLRENERHFGIRGELHSFEQSEDYYQRINAAFPDILRPYLTLHRCDTQYERKGPYRVLHYERPALPHREIDLVFVDGPDHIYQNMHYRDYIFFDSDLVELVQSGVNIRYVVNDQRWFHVPFFKQYLPHFQMSISTSYKSLSLLPCRK